MSFYNKMTIREFLALDIDIDVCDDYDERCFVNFCGPIILTPEGEKEFGPVLEHTIFVPKDTFMPYASIACIEVNGEEDCDIMQRLFYAAAGFCSIEDSEKWFQEG